MGRNSAYTPEGLWDVRFDWDEADRPINVRWRLRTHDGRTLLDMQALWDTIGDLPLPRLFDPVPPGGLRLFSDLLPEPALVCGLSPDMVRVLLWDMDEAIAWLSRPPADEPVIVAAGQR